MSLLAIFWLFFKIGIFTFGGGYAMIPLFHAELVSKLALVSNTEFGNVEETGLLIAVDELCDDKRMRYIESFAKENPDAIKLTSGANKVFYIPGDENNK